MKLGAAWERDSVYSIREVVTAYLDGAKPAPVKGFGWVVDNPARVAAEAMDKDPEGFGEIARVATTLWRARVQHDIAAAEKKIKDLVQKIRNLEAESNSMQKEIDDRKKEVNRSELEKKIAANMALAEKLEGEVAGAEREAKELGAALKKKGGEIARDKLLELVKQC